VGEVRQVGRMKTDPLEKNLKTMQMLAATEEAVGRLYEIYANRFPEHEEFWFGLTMEEADHSNSILDLISKVRKGSANFFANQSLVENVQKFQDHLKQQQSRAKREDISFIDALHVALDIEKSLIEREFYRLFEGVSVETRNVLKYLDSASGNHIKVLQREIEQQKKR